MYLTERKLFFSVNHVFSGLTGRRELEDFNWFASYVPAFEVRNGQMWHGGEHGAERLAKRLNKVGVAGSDSHTLAGVGLNIHSSAGIANRGRVLRRATRRTRRGPWRARELRKADSGYLSLRRFLLKEKPWTAAILPFTVLVPGDHRRPLAERDSFLQEWARRLKAK